MPVSSFPLPESAGGAFDAIIIKVEGNLMSINMSWMIKDEVATVATGVKDACGMCVNVQGTFEQLELFNCVLDNKSIEYAFKFKIAGDPSPPPLMCHAIVIKDFEQAVLVTKFNAVISGTAPITYTARLTMVVGDIATASIENVVG